MGSWLLTEGISMRSFIRIGQILIWVICPGHTHKDTPKVKSRLANPFATICQFVRQMCLIRNMGVVIITAWISIGTKLTNLENMQKLCFI